MDGAKRRMDQCRIGVWNIRGGMSAKMNELCEVMDDKCLDVICMSETKKKGSGLCEVNGRRLIWSGVSESQHAKQGVAAMLSGRMSECLRDFKCVSPRLIWLRLKIGITRIFLIIGYGPCGDAADAEKDEFWECVRDSAEIRDNNERLILVGDLNGWVGTRRKGYERVLGSFGDVSTNDNGNRLLEVCMEMDLFVANTFFAHKKSHQYTWERKNGDVERSIIDFVCVDSKLRKLTTDTRVFRGAEIGTDHFLVVARINLFSGWRSRPKEEAASKRIRIEKLSENTKKCEYLRLTDSVIKKREMQENEYTVEECWKVLKDTVVGCAIEVCGEANTGRKKGDAWWDSEVKDAVSRKKGAWIKLVNAKSEYERDECNKVYKECKKVVKGLVRKKKRLLEENECKKLSVSASGNLKMFWKEVRKRRSGKNDTMSDSIKDKTGCMLTESNDVVGRWKEYFEELFETNNGSGTVCRLDSKNECYDVCPDIGMNELLAAMKKAKNGKAAGCDRISTELIKYAGGGDRQGPPQPSPPGSPPHGGGRYGVYGIYPPAPPAAHRGASITTTTAPVTAYHKVSESLLSTAASNFSVGALSASTSSNSPYSPLQLEILGSYTNHQHNASTSSILIEQQQQHTTTFQTAKKMEDTKFIASRQQCFNSNAVCCEIQTEDQRCWDGKVSDVITTTMQPVTIKTENIITTSKKSCNTCVIESPVKKIVPHFVNDASLISNGGCSRTNPVTWNTTIPVSAALQVQVKREPQSSDSLLPIKMEQNSPSAKAHTVVDVVSHQPTTTVAPSVNNGSIPVGIAVARQRLPHELSTAGSTLLSTTQKDQIPRFPDMDVVGGGLVVEEVSPAWPLPQQPGNAAPHIPPPATAWQYPPQMSMEACVGGGSLQLVRDPGGGGLQLVREAPSTGLQLVRDPTSGALLLLPPAPTYLQAQPQPPPPTLQHQLQPQHMHDVWQEQFQQAVVWGGYGGVGTGVLLPHLPPPLAPLQLLGAELLTASSTTLHHHTTHQTHHSTRLVALTADPKPRPRPPPPPDQQGFVLYQVDCREHLNSPDLTPPLQPQPPEVQDASNQTDTPTPSEEEEFNSNHAAECASEDIKHILIPRNIQPQVDNIRITTGDNNIQITPMVYVDSAVQTKREPKTPGIECSITLSIPDSGNNTIVTEIPESKELCDKVNNTAALTTVVSDCGKGETINKECENNRNVESESQVNNVTEPVVSNNSPVVSNNSPMVNKECAIVDETVPLKVEEVSSKVSQIKNAEMTQELKQTTQVDLSGLELLSNSIEQFETRSKSIDTNSSKPPVLHMPSLIEPETTPPTKIDKKSLPPPPLILIKTSPKSPNPTPDVETSHFSFSPRTPFKNSISEQGNTLGGLNLLCALAEQRFMEEEEEEKRSDQGTSSLVNEDSNSQESINCVNIKTEKHDIGYHEQNSNNKLEIEKLKINSHQKFSKYDKDLKKEIKDFKGTSSSLNTLTERRSFEKSRNDSEIKHIDKRRQSDKSKPNVDTNKTEIEPVSETLDKSLQKIRKCSCNNKEPHECEERTRWLNSMSEMEMNLILRLADLERQFKEKQKELNKLSPKKSIEESCKRGPGRPRKKSTASDRTSSPPSNIDLHNFRTNQLTVNYSSLLNGDGNVLKRSNLTKSSEDENSQLNDIREESDLRSISPVADSNSSQSSIATIGSSKKRKVGRPKKVSAGSHIATETIVAKKPKSKSSLVGYLLATKSKLNLPSNKGGIIYSKTNPPRPSDDESLHKKIGSKNLKGIKLKTNLKSSENNLYSSPTSSVSEYKFTTSYDVKQKYASLLSNDNNTGSKMRPKLKAEPKLKDYSEEDDVNNDWCAPRTSLVPVKSLSSSMESLEDIQLRNKQKVDQISHKHIKTMSVKKKCELQNTYDSSDSELECPRKRRKSNKTVDRKSTSEKIDNKNNIDMLKVENDEHYDASDSDNNEGVKEKITIKVEDIATVDDILHKRVDRGRCTLDLDNLGTEEVRVLTAMGGLFYAGSFRAVQPPDVYAVTLDGERGHKPHILSREEALRDTILEVLPASTAELLPGTRLCAYWSQQYRCLYPGTVAEPSTPDPQTDHKFVSVEFDDGDSGRIALEDIRLLQPDYPIVEYDQNPLLTLSKRRRQTSVNSTTDDKKINVSVTSTSSHDLNNSSTQTPKLSGLETFVSKSEQTHLEAEFNHRERKRLKKHKKDKLKRLHSRSGDENSEDFIRKKKKKHKCCEDHCKHRKHHKKHHRKHKKHHHSSSKERSCSSSEDPGRNLNPFTDQSQLFEMKDVSVSISKNIDPIVLSNTLKTQSHSQTNSVDSTRSKPLVKKKPFKVINKSPNKSKPLMKCKKQATTDSCVQIVKSDSEGLVQKIKISPGKKKKEQEKKDNENDTSDIDGDDSDSPVNTSLESNGKKSKAKKRTSSTSEGGGSKMAAFLPAGAQLWGWRGAGYRRPQARGRARKCFYKSIQRGTEVINVGDSAVFLSTGRPDRPYIGQVESLWEGWQGGMAVKVRWYYHPEETVTCPALLTPGGLFESPHTDENDVQTISHRCEVTSLAQYKGKLSSQGQKRDGNDTYYLAGHYDPTHQTLTMEPDIPFMPDT